MKLTKPDLLAIIFLSFAFGWLCGMVQQAIATGSL